MPERLIFADPKTSTLSIIAPVGELFSALKLGVANNPYSTAPQIPDLELIGDSLILDIPPETVVRINSDNRDGGSALSYCMPEYRLADGSSRLTLGYSGRLCIAMTVSDEPEIVAKLDQYATIAVLHAAQDRLDLQAN